MYARMLLLFLLVPAVFACSDGAFDGPESVTGTGLMVQTQPARFRRMAAFTGGRGCFDVPMPGGEGTMKASYLFVDKKDRPMGGILASYCLLEWFPQAGGPMPPAADVQKQMRSIVEGAALDLQVSEDPISLYQPPVQPVAGLGQHIWSIRRDEFREAMGRSVTSGASPASAAMVRVAVVDSLMTEGPGVTTRYANDPRLVTDHGLTVARLIEDAVCDDSGACLAEIVSHRALCLDANEQPVTGATPGDMGEPTCLAQAIIGAVQDRKPGQQLVINLSLAWAPTPANGGSLGDIQLGERPPVAAVHEALEYAACHGALVVAAAGNNDGGINGQYDGGLTYPAAWQGFDTLSIADCNAQFGLASAKAIQDAPLLTAVHAVNDAGVPIAMTRSGSRTVAAAVGYFGVTGRALTGKNSGASTGFLSGTSVSAAVVSGAFAAAWSAAPSWDGGRLRSEVVRSGRATGRTAEACGRPSCAQTRIIDVTSALRQACAASGCGWAIDKWLGSGQRYDPALYAPTGSSADPEEAALCSVRGVKQEILVSKDNPPKDPCPDRSSDVHESNVNPTPGRDPCGQCDLRKPPVINSVITATENGIVRGAQSSGSMVSISYDTRHWSRKLTGRHLVVVRANGRQTIIDLRSLAGGAITEGKYGSIDNIAVPNGLDSGDTARLIFEDENGNTIASELLVTAP